MYDGKGLCRHHNVAKRFTMVLECVAYCGGMGCDFFKRMTVIKSMEREI
jgi:hypothetical protein